MRILVVTAGCLFFFLLSGIAVKQWGRSRVYVEYNHPMLRLEAHEAGPRIFIKPQPGQLRSALSTGENLYLDLAITADQILVAIDEKPEKPIRYQQLKDLKNKVVRFEDLRVSPTDPKKYIFNLVENVQAVHFLFFDHMKKFGLEKGQNFMVVSDYDPPLSALKEEAPAFIFGTSKPEILRIVAMQSMYLIEAVSLRADVVIYPLKIRNRDFYNATLITEISRRHKKIIIGPIEQKDLFEAQKLKPLGIVINGERS